MRKIWYNESTMRQKQTNKIIRAKQIARMPRRPSLFWDVDPKTVDPKKHAWYIIERIVDFGTDREVRWLYQTYSPLFIRGVVRNSRVVHPQSRSLWEAITK